MYICVKDQLKKCLISKYDDTIKKAPFKTIPIDSVEVFEPDKGGVEFATRLKCACRMKGYYFKFYTISMDKNFDYEIIIYN